MEGKKEMTNALTINYLENIMIDVISEYRKNYVQHEAFVITQNLLLGAYYIYEGKESMS